jgi:general stress protein 26
MIIEPVQAEFNQKLRDIQAPPAVIEQIQVCARAAAPVLADKALGDWWWAGTTMVYVTIGMQTPERVLLDIVPSCAPALDAAKPFLNSIRS